MSMNHHQLQRNKPFYRDRDAGEHSRALASWPTRLGAGQWLHRLKAPLLRRRRAQRRRITDCWKTVATNTGLPAPSSAGIHME